MGITIPKLPTIPKLSAKLNNTPSARGNFFKPLMIGTPIWAERDENYLNVAFDIRLQHPRVIVVEYKKLMESPNELYDGYSRIYILGADGNPVPFMSNMWRELHNSQEEQEEIGKEFYNYRIDLEGRFTFSGNTLAAKDANLAVKDLCQMYPKWSRFPTAKDYATVEKLCEAQIAIDRLKSEESHQWIADKIKSSQEAIKQEQERIAKLEKDLNELYENAADALNLFEENGLEPNMEGDGEPKKATTSNFPDSDASSLYTSSLFNHTPPTRFIGNASIYVSTEGGCRVAFSTNPGSIQVGDMVIDPITGWKAVYCGNNEWTCVA